MVAADTGSRKFALLTDLDAASSLALEWAALPFSSESRSKIEPVTDLRGARLSREPGFGLSRRAWHSVTGRELARR